MYALFPYVGEKAYSCFRETAGGYSHPAIELSGKDTQDLARMRSILMTPAWDPKQGSRRPILLLQLPIDHLGG